MMGSLFRKLSGSDNSSTSSTSRSWRKKTKNAPAPGDVEDEEHKLESDNVPVPQCAAASLPKLSDDPEDEAQQQQQQPQLAHDVDTLRQRQQHRQEEDRERRETEHRNRLIEGQKDREQKASALNQYTKQQRVRYFHKTSDQWIDEAIVVGVHYDDGPDKPYYTIKYSRPEDEATIEKQTTEDRLEEVEFDEEKTWAILDSTKKRQNLKPS